MRPTVNPFLLALVGVALFAAPAFTSAIAGGDLAFMGARTVATPTVACEDAWGTFQGCPDLTVIEEDLSEHHVQDRTFPPGHCAIEEGLVKEPGARVLLRFPTVSWNKYVESRGAAQGDLYLGRPADHPDRFYWAPCHEHYHVHEFAHYRLWTPEGYEAWQDVREGHPTWTAERVFAAYPELEEGFVAGLKQGFCLMDVRNVDDVEAGGYGCANQGIHLGWADVYGSHLDGQWIDVTDVVQTRGGAYWLEVEVNPNHFFRENDYSNNRGAMRVTLPGPVPPGAPVRPATAPGPGAGEVTVTWEPPAEDGGKPVTEYRVYRMRTGGSPALLASVPADATRAFTDTGLAQGETRRYAVSAVNVAGESALSGAVDGTPPVPPGAPRRVDATGGPAFGEVTVTWKAPAVDGGTAVTGYRVYRADVPGDEAYHLVGESADATFVDATAPLEKVVVYRVTAVNVAGEGAPSGSACTAPHALGDTLTRGTACGVALWTLRDA